MKQLTLATAFMAALVLFCGRPGAVHAQGDTKIVIKDGGSILLQADGFDGGAWHGNLGRNTYVHRSTTGRLAGLRVLDNSQDKCANAATCGIDTSKPWTVAVQYNSSNSMTIASHNGNKGIHLKDASFKSWKKNGTTDQRMFGTHGDGSRISSVTVNGGSNLCTSGQGCEVDITYAP